MLKQYASSPIMAQLVANMQTYLDPSVMTEQFYTIIWNIDTAQGIGLDIWGRIVGVNRSMMAYEAQRTFGFAEAQSTINPVYGFNDGVFNVPANPLATKMVVLTDDAFRVAILMKAACNLSGCDAHSINQFLVAMFATRGRAWSNDIGNMQMRYLFEFVLHPYERTLFFQGNLLPRPSGVQTYGIEFPLQTLGFAEAGDSAYGFSDGCFLNQNTAILAHQ